MGFDTEHTIISYVHSATENCSRPLETIYNDRTFDENTYWLELDPSERLWTVIVNKEKNASAGEDPPLHYS